MNEYNLFHGPNAGFVLELFERYQRDPKSVDPQTRTLFDNWSPEAVLEATATVTVPRERISRHTELLSADDVHRIVAAARVTRLVRELGHLAAHVDPLGIPPPGDPNLELHTHSIDTQDLIRMPASVVGGPLAVGAPTALEALGRLRKAYSGTVGYETDHIQNDEQRRWMWEAIESRRFFDDITPECKRTLLERLTEVETFERYLDKTFLHAKRFSIEGNDMLVPMLDEIVHKAAIAQVKEVVLGMSHRGRLNVLAHLLGKPYEAILAGFSEGYDLDPESESNADLNTRGWMGDVKYHLGFKRNYKERGIAEMPITLVPNPSHLEFVNPVVTGHTRAAQEIRKNPGLPKLDCRNALAITVHGDSAFPGQGVVAETLNLWNLDGYRVGGTIHIIANNQIGFTTLPKEGRSTLYAGDLAKGFEIPIVHVNADDPEACLAVARMAFAFQQQFLRDFMIDLVGYRRHGHNEGDEPRYTQPRMYEIIKNTPTVREKWAKELEKQSVVTRDEANAIVRGVEDKLKTARKAGYHEEHEEEAIRLHIPQETVTTVTREKLEALNEELLQRPEDFTANPKLESILQKRRANLHTPGGIDWGHAESLALASILSEGIPIRLTGQDTERGTFGHRNLVLHDPTSGDGYSVLGNLPSARASFAIHNSPLSESAALGFEYGYSIHAPGVLVLWEAQFGDFANSAQVIIDQFIVSGYAKWRQASSMVMLLPHGYEGGGPEHSSARLERFLQLCANDNMIVANCSNSAQYFHLLRRQAALLETNVRPLIVMTPKSLLRHPKAGSSLEDLTHGRFQPIIDDPSARERADKVTRIILCSGKIYVDLIANEEFQKQEAVAGVRMEELYPFPEVELKEVLDSYPNLKEVVWLQEEPCNQGAWVYVAPRIRDLSGWKGELLYSGRYESASTAEGSTRRHKIEQGRIIASALKSVPDLATRVRTPARAR